MENKKNYISVFTDTAFFAFIAFLFTLTVIGRKINRPYSLIISAFIALSVSVLAFGFLLSRKSKRILKQKEKQNAEIYLLQLAFMQKSEVFALFKKAFDNSKKPVTKLRNAFRSEKENCVYALSTGIDGASKADVVKLFNLLKKGETGKLFCCSQNNDVLRFAARFNGKITIIGGEKTYGFLKENDALPEIKFSPLNEKPVNIKSKLFLKRKKAVKFFLFGLGFALMSFIAYYNVYYVVAGCSFLILAAAAALFGKTEQTT